MSRAATPRSAEVTLRLPQRKGGGSRDRKPYQGLPHPLDKELQVREKVREIAFSREEYTNWLPSNEWSALKTYKNNVIQTEQVVFSNMHVITINEKEAMISFSFEREHLSAAL